MEEPLIETRNKYKEWIVWIPFFVIPLLFYPGALRSSWVGNSDIHAMLEFGAAVIALSAALIILVHFFATGKKYFLLFSLGFILQGTEDLIHAAHSFTRFWPVEIVRLKAFIPGTYVAGRLILITCIFIGIYFIKTAFVVNIKKRTKNAILFISIGFIGTYFITNFIIHSPLPQFILPGKLISRPVDFAVAILYLFAFFFFVKIYRQKEHRTPFMWSMMVSVIFGFVTQIYMVH